MVDIVSIGECFIEFFTYERLHAEADWELVYSGDTFNVLAMANRLGTSCGYVTRISDDPFGDYLLEEWRRRGIDTTHVRQVRGYNAVEFSSSEPVGEGSKVVYRKGAAASTMTPDDIDPAYISGAKILHVSGISQGISRTCRETVLAAVKIAHDSGVLVSYDTNLRVNLWKSLSEARDAMEELLPYIDIITPSFPHEPAALIDLHTEQGVGTPWKTFRIPGVAPRGLLHTSGAGDTFVGGLLHCIASGMDAVEGARWGVASAGLKVGGPSIEAQPTRDEVLDVLESVRVKNVTR